MNNPMKPIVIQNHNGKHLFGILHLPSSPSKKFAIILLSPGIKNRVGPHRLYVKLSNHFSSMGYPVFRFDPEGLGDSEGEIDENWTADVYCSIELGCLVQDAIKAMDFMEGELGISQFILSGLCGGAITALLTGNADSRVKAILALGMTCTLASSGVDPLKYITKGQLQSIRKKYFKKILNVEAWWRFISFKSDYRLLVNAITKPILNVFRTEKKPIVSDETSVDLNNIPPDTNLNPHFPKTFIDFIKNRKISLIFSESDRLYWEFEEKFMHYYGYAVKSLNDNLEKSIIKNANHVFSFSEWQQEMIATSTDWLERNF